jgi:hypothetical protein
VPANSGMLALDEDGTACSSDYYLRLTGDGGRMLKGQIALTQRPDRHGRQRGRVALIANRTAIGLWETFQLIHNPNGTVSLLAGSTTAT